MFEKTQIDQKGCRSCPGSIYMFMTVVFKDLLRNRLANQSQTSCGVSMGRGNEILYNGQDNMTKIAATPMYGKNLYKFPESMVQ